MGKLDNFVRYHTIPPGQREENLEAANWSYKKRVEEFRDWIARNGTAEQICKFNEIFGETLV